MRKYGFLLVLIASMMFFSSCEDEYTDTKDVGTAYLEQNAKSDTVNVLPNGLQYKIISEKSDAPYPPDIPTYVTVKYTATFINGDTLKTDSTSTVYLYSAIVEGWKQVMGGVYKRMRIGSHWKLWVPYNLAYGSSGTEDGTFKVDPYSALIYDITLVYAY